MKSFEDWISKTYEESDWDEGWSRSDLEAAFYAGTTNDRTEDYIDKIETLNSYLKIWFNGGVMPLELSGLIEEADEFIKDNRADV